MKRRTKVLCVCIALMLPQIRLMAGDDSEPKAAAKAPPLKSKWDEHRFLNSMTSNEVKLQPKESNLGTFVLPVDPSLLTPERGKDLVAKVNEAAKNWKELPPLENGYNGSEVRVEIVSDGKGGVRPVILEINRGPDEPFHLNPPAGKRPISSKWDEYHFLKSVASEEANVPTDKAALDTFILPVDSSLLKPEKGNDLVAAVSQAAKNRSKLQPLSDGYNGSEVLVQMVPDGKGGARPVILEINTDAGNPYLPDIIRTGPSRRSFASCASILAELARY